MNTPSLKIKLQFTRQFKKDHKYLAGMVHHDKCRFISKERAVS